MDVIRAEYGPKMRAAYESGDMATAGAVRHEMGDKIEALLRPDQRAKYEALRAAARQNAGGPPGGGGL